MIRGDTPTSHAFYNAIAAACIPVVISDAFQLVGIPFKTKLDFNSYAIQIAENHYLRNPETIISFLLNQERESLRSKVETLVNKAQPLYLYDDPQSKVADAVLDELATIHWDYNV